MEVVVVRERKMPNLGLGVAGLALAMLLGCGGGTGGSSAGASGGPTVSSREVPGVGSTLVDSSGRTLYFADQEAGGQIKCVADCLTFWQPLTVLNGTAPTAGAGVGGMLATVSRPDGSAQVTYNGKPLYAFSRDGGVGRAEGNGFKDSFGGVDFLWHAAAVSGSTAPGSGPSPAPVGTGGTGYGY
jgi:predicted lipoprotein with Yx(FWY)xxD motif